jgi:hypothetical protein
MKLSDSSVLNLLMGSEIHFVVGRPFFDYYESKNGRMGANTRWRIHGKIGTLVMNLSMFILSR